MSNEILFILSVLIIYSSVLIWFALFDKAGLAGWNVLATIAANIEVLILINAFGLEQTLGNILFASTFLVTDILSEVHGKKEANKAVNIGIATSVSFIILSQSWLLYTPSPNDVMLPSIRAIFSNTPRLMFSSLIVYAIAQRLDVWLYHALWDLTTKITGNKHGYLWLRNNLATLTSQLVNVVLFTTLAFYGQYPFSTLKDIVLSSFIIFIFTSLLDTPFVYLARAIHERKSNTKNV